MKETLITHRDKISVYNVSIGVWILFIALIAHGCTRLNEDEDILAPTGSEAIEKVESEAFESGIFTPTEWIDETWWHLYGDPQLTNLIERALADNPSVKLADAQVWIANAEAKGQAAALYPHLALEEEVMRVHVSKTGLFENAPPTLFPFNFTQTGILFKFSYELDWWGKNRNALAAAVGMVKAAIAESAAARLAIALSVAEAYLHYQNHLEIAEIEEQLSENQQKRYALTQQRVDRGIDTHINLQKRQRDVLQANDKAIAAHQAKERAGYRIQALLAGDFQSPVVARKAAALQAPFALPVSVPLDLISHRADITAQLWAVYSQARQVDIAKALFYPDINLIALLGWQTIHIQKLFDSNSRAAMWGGALHLPLFEGGALRANLEEQKVTYSAAVFEYERLILHAVEETLEAISALKFLHSRIEEARNSVESATQTFELIKERFQHNLASQFDVLAAESEWLHARESEVKL